MRPDVAITNLSKRRPSANDESAAATTAPAGPPLKVVMFIPYDLQYQPFAIRSIRFASELARRGHKVTVFYRPMATTSGAAIHRNLPDTFERKLLKGVMRLSPACWRAASEAVAECDVVHFQKSLPPATLPAVALAKLHRKPLHQDWDDYEIWFWLQAARDAWNDRNQWIVERVRRTLRALRNGAVTGSAEALIPRLADTIGAASSELRRASRALGADPQYIFPARVGVDSDVFHPGKRDEQLRAELGLTGPTVLFAGSLDLHPDLVFFIESLKQLTRQVPEAQCLVVGGGFGRPRLVAAVKEAGLERSVRMTDGFVPFADMPRYVASTDLAALPFRNTRVNRGKSSLTLLECMASGIPAVSHDVGDVAWMMGGAGELAEHGDPQSFGDKLAGLARDEKRRSELGQLGRKRAVEIFSWQGTVDQLERAYRAAIARHRGAHAPGAGA